ncbi:MAG: DUF5656 family protein [Chloroflexota bacterium]
MISQERLLVLTVLFTMALGVSLTLGPGIDLPYGLALALLAGVSVPYLLHTHPAYVFSPVRLIIPAGVALAAPSIARLLANNSVVLVGVFGPPTLLYACIYAEYQVVRPSTSGKAQIARLLLTLAAYVVALAIFVLLEDAKARALVSAPLAAVTGGLLALRLFTVEQRQEARTGLYAAVIGLTMAEVIWPLNYWVLSAAAGAAALLMVFYVVVGVTHHLLARDASWRLVVEYVSVGATGALCIVMASRL